MSEVKTGRIAIGFPGQGAQDPEQIRRLLNEHPVALDVFLEGEEVLHEPLLPLALRLPEVDSTTRDNQVKLYLGSCALWRAAEVANVIPNGGERVFFGASAGEYAALTAANRWDFATGLEQIDIRGREMQRAGVMNPGTMLVASGLSFDEAEKVAARFKGVYAVNDNPGSQTVFSGSDVGLRDMAAYLASSEAWNHVRLDWPSIAEAAHSIHMAPAVAGVQEALKKVKFKKPSHVFVGNRARPLKSASGLKSHLAEQLTRGVLLRQSTQFMKEEYGVSAFVDVGPGRVLYTQMRHQFRKSVELISVIDELLPEKQAS